jgi:hypothetical protein
MKETMGLRTYGFTTRALTVERHDEFSGTTGAVPTCCVVLTIMQYPEQCLQPHDYLHQFVSCPPLWASLYVMLHIALTPSCSAYVEFSLNSWLLDRKSLVWRVSCVEKIVGQAAAGRTTTAFAAWERSMDICSA